MTNDRENTDKPESAGKWTRTGKVTATFAAAMIAVGGLLGVQALAESNTVQHLRLAAGSDWHGGWRGHGRGGFAELSEAEIEDKVGRMVKHLGIEIDATDEQEAQLTELAVAAAREIQPMRERMRDSRNELHELLMADSIDRDALNSLRTRQISEFDELSRTLMDKLASAAEVLTPEQRVLLEKRVEEYRGHHRWRRGGGRD